MSQILARRLKTERELKGWTQAEMAKQLGISNGTLSGYERDYREPDLNTLDEISNLLNVSSDYLLGKTPKKNSAASVGSTAASGDDTLPLYMAIEELSDQSQRLIREQIDHLHRLEHPLAHSSETRNTSGYRRTRRTRNTTKKEEAAPQDVDPS
ncbi:MAG: helix-turn-helix domain-containing protein [Peptococcaceae bacterium]|nr:helix-turn-helix domain-containing protein [Peptococcaceae bacterium]